MGVKGDILPLGHHGGKGGHFTLLRTLSVEVVYLVVYRGHHEGNGGHFTLLRTLSVEVVYLVVYRGHHEGNGGHFTLLRTLSVEVVYLVVYRGHHVGKGGQKCRWGIWRCMGDTMGVKGDRSIGRHSGWGTGVWGTPEHQGRRMGDTCSVWGTLHELVCRVHQSIRVDNRYLGYTTVVGGTLCTSCPKRFFKVKCTSFGALSECHKVIDDGLKAPVGALGLCTGYRVQGTAMFFQANRSTGEPTTVQ
ncbi:hypothetical protein C8F04DRAFT_1182038 [Mycena alexandri]|uniref:Uncharacterized protein n=1 Tax=Mycena alexandri TaxID=1745969 RepID=A0AAD6SXS3_9AGAR|nr:hypothetical protein C8F04DRAFT_1182038 [Mycena alexandri]